jgi:hypothetical protein
VSEDAGEAGTRHPAPERIALLLDGPASAEEGDGTDRWVAEHAAGCLQCQQTLADIREVRAALAAVPPVPLPASVATRVERALALKAGHEADPEADDFPDRGTPLRSRRPGSWWLAAAASAALLIGGGVVVRGIADGPSSSHDGAKSSAGSANTRSEAGSSPEVANGQPPAPAGLGRDAAKVPAQVRALLAAQPSPPRIRTPDVAHCLAVLGVPPDRLAVSAPSTLGGAPVTILVLTAGVHQVDVRVVRPGCVRGTADILYRRNNLPVS